MNIAWNKFARDLENFDISAKEYFATVFDSISNNGGNAIRWWLHTNGMVSPVFDDNGNVFGIKEENLDAMKQVLDMAFDRGITISMCLWSFDMLQDQGQNKVFTRGLLEDAAKTQTYIDNALVPLINRLGDHPAVMTWEIFNEPEGMVSNTGVGGGWSDETTEIFYIQRFINLTAGAIHRTMPGLLVSNGSWSFRANTAIENNINFYTDAKLIAAGGDVEGTLDFYQVHYYAEHFGNELSPFHRPASHWGLNKPIVIGEFRSTGLEGKPDPSLTTLEAYKRAIEFGYAGAMSWSWTDSDINVFTETMGVALNYIYDNYAADVMIDNTGIDLERVPELVDGVPAIREILGDNTDFTGYADLSKLFLDKEDGIELNYSVFSNSNEGLLTASLSNTSLLDITLMENVEGTAEVTLRATDSDGWSANNTFQIIVKSSEGQKDNLAFFKPAYASSMDNSQHPEIYINDGSSTTRWSSAYTDSEWIYIDFEEAVSFNYLSLEWEAAFASEYDIQTSDNAEDWTTVYTESAGDGEEDFIIFDQPLTSRYLRMKGNARATQWGFSIYEIIVKNVNNSAPSIVQAVDNYEFNLSELEPISEFIFFEEVFTDLEDPQSLAYAFELSNEDLISLTAISDNNLLDLNFLPNAVGTTEVTLTATDPFGASISTSFNVTVIDDILAIRTEELMVSVFPNPTNDIITFGKPYSGQMITNISVIDLEGRTLEQLEVNNEVASLDLTKFGVGIYLVQTQLLDGTTVMTRVIKE